MPFYLKPSPEILDGLRSISFPFDSVDDLTGLDSTSLALFSDYGPNDTDFQTCAFYLVDCNDSVHLCRMLNFIKQRRGIAARTIDFKGRKDRAKRQVFREWIRFIRHSPGMLYIVGFDRRLKQAAPTEWNALKKQLKDGGLNDNPKVYDRMIKGMSFIAALGPYLKSKHKLAWIMDKDQIFDTDHRKEVLLTSLGYLTDQAFQTPPSHISVLAPFDDDGDGILRQVRELLSVADIAASTLASSLSFKDEGTLLLHCRDEAAGNMIEELARFISIEDYRIGKQLSCPLGISIFVTERTDGGAPFLRHYTLKLAFSPVSKLEGCGDEEMDLNLISMRAL